MQLLKVRKVKIAQRTKIKSQINDLESMAATIQSDLQNIAFMRAVKEGTNALQKLQAELPLDEIKRIMEDTTDAIEAAREVDEAIMASATELRASGSSLEGMSDEELLAELEILDKQSQAEETKEGVRTKVETSILPTLPEVPTHSVQDVVTTQQKSTTKQAVPA